MSHYRAHYSFAFNATIIPLAFTHVVRHDIIFDPFNFKIVEHNLFTISIYIILSSFSYDPKPESFNFPSEFPFLDLRMCLILTHQPGVLPKSLLLQPSRYALRSRFIFIFRLCPRVWRFTKTTHLETYSHFPGSSVSTPPPSAYLDHSTCLYSSGSSVSTPPPNICLHHFTCFHVYMFIFFGFECKYTPSQYMSTSFYMFPCLHVYILRVRV